MYVIKQSNDLTLIITVPDGIKPDYVFCRVRATIGHLFDDDLRVSTTTSKTETFSKKHLLLSLCYLITAVGSPTKAQYNTLQCGI